MSRAKGGFKTRRRRNRILKKASGYRGARSRLIRTATEAVRHALQYAYRDRKVRKREFRSLWISRIGSAAKEHGLSYAALMGKLGKAQVAVNRKMLAELAVRNPAAFGKIVEMAKQQG